MFDFIEWMGLREAANRFTAEHQPKVYISIPVPDDIAVDWSKDGRKGEDDSDPHITVLYVGPIPEGRIDELLGIVTDACAEQEPIDIELSQGVKWFTSHEGKEIAHKGVEASSHAALEQLHQAIKDALTDAGFTIKHAGRSFKSHATLAYCDERVYEDTVPEGAWTANGLQVSVADGDIFDVSFGGQAKQADIALSHPEQYFDSPTYSEFFPVDVRESFEGEDRFEDLDSGAGSEPRGRDRDLMPGISGEPSNDPEGSYAGQTPHGFQGHEAESAADAAREFDCSPEEGDPAKWMGRASKLKTSVRVTARQRLQGVGKVADREDS